MQWIRLRNELRAAGADTRGMCASLDAQISSVIKYDDRHHNGSTDPLPQGWKRGLGTASEDAQL